MSDPTRRRRSPTPYPSRERRRSSQNEASSPRLLSNMVEVARQRCGWERASARHRDHEKPQCRKPSQDSVQPLREKPSRDEFERGRNRCPEHHHAQSNFHEIFSTLSSYAKNLACGMFPFEGSKTTRSKCHNRDGNRVGGIFGSERSLKSTKSRSTSPRYISRRTSTAVHGEHFSHPWKGNHSIGNRRDDGSSQSAAGQDQQRDEERTRLQGALRHLQADMRLARSTIQLRSHQDPNDDAASAAMARFEVQVDRLVKLAADAENRCPPASQHSTPSDGGNEQQRGRIGSIVWVDQATVPSPSGRKQQPSIAPPEQQKTESAVEVGR